MSAKMALHFRAQALERIAAAEAAGTGYVEALEAAIEGAWRIANELEPGGDDEAALEAAVGAENLLKLASRAMPALERLVGQAKANLER